MPIELKVAHRYLASQASAERNRKVACGRCRPQDLQAIDMEELRKWRLKEVVHSLPTKGQLIGLRVTCELTRCSRRPNPHVFVAQASRSSPVLAPPGIHIHSGRRLSSRLASAGR